MMGIADFQPTYVWQSYHHDHVFDKRLQAQTFYQDITFTDPQLGPTQTTVYYTR